MDSSGFLLYFNVFIFHYDFFIFTFFNISFVALKGAFEKSLVSLQFSITSYVHELILSL